MKKFILHEVGMRDGLQVEKTLVPIEKKIEWTKKLSESAVDIIQLGSFVNPSKVPQMADTDELFKYFKSNPLPNPNTILSGLVLNEKGLERAMNVGVDMICMGVSASETHSMKNTGMTVAEASDRIINMAKSALQEGKNVQVSVQSAFGCGFEGKIDESKVISIVSRFADAGLKQISLADTAGHAFPEQVSRLYKRILDMIPDAQLACHFHNTYGLGMANIFSAMLSGVKYFEAAFGGLGGCPFTKKAAGNVSTEDVVAYWHRNSLRNDINLDILIDLASEVSQHFEKELPGYIYKTGNIKY